MILLVPVLIERWSVRHPAFALLAELLVLLHCYHVLVNPVASERHCVARVVVSIAITHLKWTCRDEYHLCSVFRVHPDFAYGWVCRRRHSGEHWGDGLFRKE